MVEECKCVRAALSRDPRRMWRLCTVATVAGWDGTFLWKPKDLEHGA